MNKRALKVLEYDKIKKQLADFAGSRMGREYCEALLPSNQLEEIKRMQKETTDALIRILRKGSLSFSGIPDIRGSIKRLEIESILGAGELMGISSVLTATLRTKNYGKSIGGREEEGESGGDSLSERFDLLEPLSPINHEILRCIISEEEIADDASTGLKSVRRAIHNTNEKLHAQLQSIMNASSSKGMLQDALVTTRNGRYCLPIKVEYKSQFPGMIHDQSSSGSTVFVEPMAVVKLNNELRELEIREKEEIEKVLEQLSMLLFPETENLQFNLSTLAEFDFIFARASLSKQMKASEPSFNNEGYLQIKKGRHPLIDPKKVVPIDIHLGKEFDMLVITGPNTGGKTVSLKTVGLFSLMGQAGLHIPAWEGSELTVFDEVYADIGDEQSIEQSLSTFSSHMKNTVSILQEVGEHSLVLFDELGAGTDPTEGAALAMAILTSLHEKGIRTLATTHYSELKVFALSTKGVSNACCEFDVETLSPTYRLLIGMPGKSNAFAISAKLGLPKQIIDIADSFIGTKDKSFEDLIRELDMSRLEIEKEKEAALEKRKEAEELKRKLQQKNERIDTVKDRLLREANEQAHEILQKAKDYADETIRKYQKWGSQTGANKEMEQERSQLRDLLLGHEEKLVIQTKQKRKPLDKKEELKVGDRIHVLSLNVEGTVSTLPNGKGDFYVQIGALRSQVNISDIERLKPVKEEIKSGRTEVSKIKMSKSFSIRPECNLIGKRVDEALPILDKYLDDAYLAHLPKVTIIHGRGTGALRDAVQSHLKRTKYVASFRIGSFGEGDQGVTIVEFKQ